MKKLRCEICGSENVIKTNGLFVCQECDTKYSLEEAKRIMGINNNETNNSSFNPTNTTENLDLERLYKNARAFMDAKNYDDAATYYDKILLMDSDSWEANFYSLYCKCWNNNVYLSLPSIISLSNSMALILVLVKNNNADEINIISDICEKSVHLVSERYLEIRNEILNQTTYSDEQWSLIEKLINVCVPLVTLLYNLGQYLSETFNDIYSAYSVICWKEAVLIHQAMSYVLEDPDNNHKNAIIYYTDRIHEFDCNFDPSDPSTL